MTATVRRTTLLILFLLLFVATAAYADIEEAYAAYDNGNYSRALALFTRYAEDGDAEAEYALGGMYYDGKGVKQDLEQAARWLLKAAEHGLPDAQLFLGSLYYDGAGVKQDFEAAFKWYVLAAGSGNIDAEFNLGYMYEYGLGVSIDCDKAEAWYLRAANQGDEEAQEILQFFTCRDYANVAALPWPRLHGGRLVRRPPQASGVNSRFSDA